MPLAPWEQPQPTVEYDWAKIAPWEIPEDEPVGYADRFKAVPQVILNMATGTLGQVAGGLAGMYKLVESGMDWDEATKSVESVAQGVASKLRVDFSDTGNATEEWIAEKIKGLETSTEQSLIEAGMDPARARLVATLGVQGGLVLVPFGIKPGIAGIKTVGRAAKNKFTRSITAHDAPTIGAPWEAPVRSGGPIEHVAPPPLADRVYATAEAQIARQGGAGTPPVPPIVEPAVAPPEPSQPVTEAPVVQPKGRVVAEHPVEGLTLPPEPPTFIDRLLRREPKEPPATWNAPPKKIPTWDEGSWSNLIDSPMYRAIRITGGENNPIVAGLRKLETDIIQRRQEFQPLEMKYATAVSKLNDSQKAAYKAAYLTGDSEGAIKILSKSPVVRKKGEAQQLMVDIKTALDKRFKDVVDSGVKQTYTENFLPRRVVDPKGFAKEFEKLILEQKANGKHTGAELSSIDSIRAEVRALQTAINNKEITWPEYYKGIDDLLMGDVTRKILDPKGIHSRERKLPQVPKRLQKFYAEPGESLAEYFNDTSRVLAERKYLGKGYENVEDGVTNMLATELAKGNLNDVQFRELKKVLQERFSEQGRRSASPVTQGMKQAGYMGTIANPLSAMVNVLDLIPTAMRYGIARTLGGAARHVLGGKKRMNPLKMGLHEAAIEIEQAASKRFSGTNMLDTSMKVGGFKMMDRFGKGSYMNAARSKGMSLASSKGGLKKLEKKGWRHIYKTGDEWTAFTDALKKGDFDNPMVQEFVVAELLETQPVALSSMPISYIRHPNGRIFYMLKTWAIRQMNSVREAYYKGNKYLATKLAAGIIGSGMAAPYVRDLIASLFGDVKSRKDESVPDKTVSALLRALLVDKFNVENVAKTGKTTGLVGEALNFPALGMIGASIKDAIDAFSGEFDSVREWSEKGKAARYVPIVGAIGARLER